MALELIELDLPSTLTALYSAVAQLHLEILMFCLALGIYSFFSCFFSKRLVKEPNAQDKGRRKDFSVWEKSKHVPKHKRAPRFKEKVEKVRDLPVDAPTEDDMDVAREARDVAQKAYDNEDYESMLVCWESLKQGSRLSVTMLMQFVRAMQKCSKTDSEIVEELKQFIQSNKTTCGVGYVNNLLSLLVKCLNWCAVIRLVDFLPAMNIEADCNTFEVIVEIHFLNKDFDEVHTVLRRMHVAGITPTRGTVLLQFKTALKTAHLDEALRCYRQLAGVGGKTESEYPELRGLSHDLVVLACHERRIEVMYSDFESGRIRQVAEMFEAMLQECASMKDGDLAERVRNMESKLKVVLPNVTIMAKSTSWLCPLTLSPTKDTPAEDDWLAEAVSKEATVPSAAHLKEIMSQPSKSVTSANTLTKRGAKKCVPHASELPIPTALASTDSRSPKDFAVPPRNTANSVEKHHAATEIAESHSPAVHPGSRNRLNKLASPNAPVPPGLRTPAPPGLHAPSAVAGKAEPVPCKKAPVPPGPLIPSGTVTESGKHTPAPPPPQHWTSAHSSEMRWKAVVSKDDPVSSEDALVPSGQARESATSTQTWQKTRIDEGAVGSAWKWQAPQQKVQRGWETSRKQQQWNTNYLVGLWEGSKGETYKVSANGNSSWTCTRQGGASWECKVFTFYGQGDGIYWWGSGNKYFLDESDSYNTENAVHWYAASDWDKHRPAFSWWKVEEDSSKHPSRESAKAGGYIPSKVTLKWVPKSAD